MKAKGDVFHSIFFTNSLSMHEKVNKVWFRIYSSFYSSSLGRRMRGRVVHNIILKKVGQGKKKVE